MDNSQEIATACHVQAHGVPETPRRKQYQDTEILMGPDLFELLWM
jgi:hypothetical protein